MELVGSSPTIKNYSMMDSFLKVDPTGTEDKYFGTRLPKDISTKIKVLSCNL